jgi:hypothetical protein
VTGTPLWRNSKKKFTSMGISASGG